MEEAGFLEFSSKAELISAFEKAGFNKVEIVAKLMGRGIVLRTLKPK
ncbi:hypothetical protein ACFLWO_01840 [Chloroflexota bacterium]